ncbi:uncharacterized protein LOC130614408 isoform X2 [Hydractinia symbiolongicarpus]|uniref:uncharacterized protein LOC130614408 isoform X2 n=1 Tax=Hydractinia symbiolongicarpus TaxID=13093 RepID=UPI00254B62B4|nr:uncharacterized protein LOC130614408 isoform X2 [Hydractinia symbiolongicarpus]
MTLFLSISVVFRLSESFECYEGATSVNPFFNEPVKLVTCLQTNHCVRGNILIQFGFIDVKVIIQSCVFLNTTCDDLCNAYEPELRKRIPSSFNAAMKSCKLTCCQENMCNDASTSKPAAETTSRSNPTENDTATKLLLSLIILFFLKTVF